MTRSVDRSGSPAVLVETPAGDPLVPRADGAEQAHADLAEVRRRVHDPVQDRGAVGHVGREVGAEAHVGGARAGHVSHDLQADLLGDLALGAVGADQKARPLGVFLARRAVEQAHGDPVLVLFVAEVPGGEGDLRTPLGRVLDQQRLHVGLRDVQHGARAGFHVVALALVPGAPGAHPGDLGARQRGGEEGVTHLVPRHCVLFGFLLDAQVPQDLHRALVGDVGAGRVRQPGPLRNHRGPHPVGRQRQRGGGAGRPGAHDEDVRVEVRGVARKGAGGVQQVGGAGDVGEVLCHEMVCHVCVSSVTLGCVAPQ